MSKFENVLEATKHWVRDFNSIPQSFILRTFPYGLDDSHIEVLATDLTCDYCGCTEYTTESSDDEDDDTLICMSCGRNEFHEARDFPMWGTMWTFGDSLDTDWVRNHGGLEAMRECGFWVYDDDDLGIFFGINGAGYNFYESHWVPLYKKRGLRWHNEAV
ncbi:hypothetical protein P4V86_03675 [Brevibacillus laterosporus]|uniref:hypothetical protein n=1 Tax=Brevibacillus laterosporus TaxID=1465 RepID=UPI00036780FC|nr:hypothetical protein [Brevibacillus laterosporus]ATO48616.1 hypothetical protein BrL25_05485 [Brevibacillus laterosporus DSM 25]MED2002458.1 hypothetical protein [Brevibacillus laterosporus]